jgi:SAM-dependent methyltransferase
MKPTTPERIMQLNTGYWASAVMAAASIHKVFTHIENGAKDAAAIAERATISPRGAAALVDGLLGLGLIEMTDGKLTNAPDAAQFLVEGRASIAMRGKTALKEMVDWAKLADCVKTGEPVTDEKLHEPELTFWEDLVLGIAPMTMMTAQFAAGPLGIDSAGAIRILDIGGGSGAFAGTLLQRDKEARSTQLDWPNVNRIARGFVEKLGVSDRFDTLDGDFHKTEFGGPYDLIIYSHIAHQEAPAENRATFKRVRAALKPNGRFVITDFIVPDGRQGMNPFTGLFHANMLLRTKAGGVWTHSEYRAWLGEAGFPKVEAFETPGPATILIAS